jgi:hypothetical protein
VDNSFKVQPTRLMHREVGDEERKGAVENFAKLRWLSGARRYSLPPGAFVTLPLVWRPIKFSIRTL